MAYKVPTLDEMLGFLVAFAKALLPDRNFGSRFVPGWKFLKTIAGAVTDVHANMAATSRDLMPDTAIKAGLDRWLGIFAPGGSKVRKGATPARKANAGRVKGTAAATAEAGEQLIHRASQLLFQLNEDVTIPGGGEFDADIVAISTGAATRLKKGEVLEFLSPPPGIKTQVELQLDLDEDGADAEQDGAARNRLLNALGTPAAGGNQADYVAWATVQLGIAAAFCYPNRAGIGTVDVAALHAGSGAARILTLGEATALQALLETLAPTQVAGVGGSLRVLTVVGETANVEIAITPDGAANHAMDWDDTTPPTVVAWTALTRLLQLSARPSSMKAGDRICIKGVASDQNSAPVIVEALSGLDSVILQEAPKKVDGTTAVPAATDVVYAGGPLTATVRDAIVAHINGDVLYAASTGPLAAAVAESSGVDTTNLEVLAEGIGTANPAGAYGTWSGGLLLDTLELIARYTRGVRKTNVVTPVADLEATDFPFPNDAQIGLLNPGYVLVRKG